MDTNNEVQVEGRCNRASDPFSSTDKHAEVALSAPQAQGSIPRTYMTKLITDRLSALFQRLGILDRLLTPLILISMIVGVVIGEFVPGVQSVFDTVQFDSVSVRRWLGIYFPRAGDR